METLIAVWDERYGVPKYAGQTMTVDEFLRWESDDNYVYEYNDGTLEPTTGMRQDEALMLKRLTRLFQKTDAFQQGGELFAEMNTWFTKTKMRRPDVSFFTQEQLRSMSTGENVIPAFVTEFGSVTDNERNSIQKRHEYFDAGVQVLWWVFPSYQEVYVYTSPKTVIICTDDDTLSAAPALPDFQMTVAELFQR